MNYFFEHFTFWDYGVLFKFVLGIYILISSIILRITEKKSNLFLRQDRNLLISYVVFLIFWSGTRGIRIGTDTINYFNFYYLRGIRIDNLIDFFTTFKTDFLFEVVMYLTFPFKSFTFFLFSISAIFNIALYFFARKFSNYGKDGSSLMLFLTITCSFSFINMELNIVRNALSITFVLLGLFYVLNKKTKMSVIFFIIAYLFHGTALIPIITIILCNLSSKIELKYFIGLYILAIGLAFIGFGFQSIPFLQNINSEDFKRLIFTGETKYRIGFRIDFVLYNSFFLFLFIKFSNLKNNKDIFLIKYFIITSIIFFFNFKVPFSDRIGLYSWIAIPILLFNTVKNSFPQKKLYISTIVTIGFFVLNYLILFPS